MKLLFCTLLLAILAGLVFVAEGRNPVLHRVGGSKFGWRLNVSFSDWASHEPFYVGDWLYFGFDKHSLSVLEVNSTGYKKCIESSFITNITRGGRDVFNLTVARPYYFISGRGFCSLGVKLAINVTDAPPDPIFNATDAVKTNYTSHAMTTATSTITLLVPLSISLVAWTFSLF